MLRKYTLNQSLVFKIVILALTFLSVCRATLGFMMCCAAFVIVRVDTPDYVLVPLTTVMITCACFIDSFLLSKVFKEKGLLIGLCTALVFVVFMIGVALVNNTFAFTNLLVTKLCSIAFAGLLGGILGVNT